MTFVQWRAITGISIFVIVNPCRRHAARGAIVAEAGRNERAVILATFDLGAIDEGRVNWGVIRDRRPELYKTILTLGGHSPRIGT